MVDRQKLAKRKWWAISIGTVLLMVSYWSIVFAFVAASTDDGPAPGPPFALGLALVPFVFMAVTFISGNPRSGSAVVVAMLLAVAVGLPASALARDAVSGLVAAYGAGGVIALRREFDHTWQSRAWAVTLAATFIFLLVRIVPEAGLVLAPIIVLPAIGGADIYVEHKLGTEP